MPSLGAWHDKYKDDGLTIIGVHYPEFSYERDIDNVKAALDRPGEEVHHPVAIDNDGQSWRAYKNRYWPTIYFIDKAGEIRFIRIGEVRLDSQTFEDLEAIIQALLAEEIS